MLISRVIRTSMLIAFAVLVAGGPTMHFAPILGHHHHGCSELAAESELVSVCGCGEIRTSLPVNELALTQRHGHQHKCDGTCSICQFFSQVNLDLATEIGVESTSQSFSNAALDSVESIVAIRFSYFERGPPVI